MLRLSGIWDDEFNLVIKKILKVWNLYEKGKGLNYALHKSLYRFLSKLKCYLDFTINIISEKYTMMIHWIQASPRLQLDSGRYMVDDNNPLMANRIKKTKGYACYRTQEELIIEASFLFVALYKHNVY